MPAPLQTSSFPGAARQGWPIWLWPNLLSLDAPIVAVLWQDLAARTLAVPLRWEGRTVLGLTVWAIYISDRLLDVRRAATQPEAARHQFYRTHRGIMTPLLAAILTVDLALTFLRLRPPILLSGLFPTAFVAAYLTSVHHRSQLSLTWPKEVLVVVLFTIGVFLVPCTFSPPGVPAVVLALSLVMLLLTNVVAIETWEWHELRRRHGQPPHVITRWMGSHVAAGAFLLALAAALISQYSRAYSQWCYAVAISAGVTAALVHYERAASLNVRRALIDAALLSPLLFLS